MNRKEVKCIIWDLDETIWNGILSEHDRVELKPGIVQIIQSLDERGILHSIASKNNFQDAYKKLEEFRLAKYFLYPQINWNAKSDSVSYIQHKLNIAMDTILFIDDQVFERDEVTSLHPLIECVDAVHYDNLLEHERLNPRFITEDSKKRRLMYLEDIKRDQEEQEFSGPKECFLARLDMKFIISNAQENDLKRAEELTVRTNQLNATGVTYGFEELDALRQSPDHELLVCELTDKYGSYGKIGLALIEKKATHWHLKMLLMSCRVMSRGVGTVLLLHIMNEAKKNGRMLEADFRVTDRNKMMYITYKLSNFREIKNDGLGNILLRNDLETIPPMPKYIQLQILKK